MELILHIGEAKTGTTSIQKSLLKNKELLLKLGILCHMNHEADHFNLIHAIGDNPRAPQNQHRNLRAKAIKLLQEIKGLSLKHKAKYILISSESFFRLTNQQQKILIAYIGLKFEAIRVIVYIRNPAEYYLSFMQQRIKADHTILDPLRYKRNIFTPLMGWLHFVGRNNIIIKPFDQKILINGNVVSDFYKVLEGFTGNKFDNLISNSQRSDNTSLSSEQVILLQKYRADFLPECKGTLHPKSSRILKFFQDMNNNSVDLLPMTKPILTSELHAIISKNNNNYVKSIDKFFGTNLLNIFQTYGNESEYKASKELYTDIADIIESYNKQTLSILFQLIPEYNHQLKSYNGKSSLPRIVFNKPIFSLCYSKYLLSEGSEYKKISEYIREQAFKHIDF